MKSVLHTNAADGSVTINPSVIDDLYYNNTAFPVITRVIYNVGKKAYPKLAADGKHVKDKDGKLVYGDPVDVLTTVAFFCDGTKVAVTNSEHDGVTFEDATEEVTKVGEDGKSYVVTEKLNFKVATHASKEAGLVYAIAKRLIGRPTANGTIEGNGFGRKLSDIVAGAYDTRYEEHIRKAKEAAAKKEYEAKKGTGKKEPRPSLAKAVDRLAEIINKLDTKLA